MLLTICKAAVGGEPTTQSDADLQRKIMSDLATYGDIPFIGGFTSALKEVIAEVVVGVPPTMSLSCPASAPPLSWVVPSASWVHASISSDVPLPTSICPPPIFFIFFGTVSHLLPSYLTGRLNFRESDADARSTYLGQLFAFVRVAYGNRNIVLINSHAVVWLLCRGAKTNAGAVCPLLTPTLHPPCNSA